MLPKGAKPSASYGFNSCYNVYIFLKNSEAIYAFKNSSRDPTKMCVTFLQEFLDQLNYPILRLKQKHYFAKVQEP